MLVSTAGGAYRQRGRAHVTRSLLIGGEILHNRRVAAERTAEGE
ncbi:hypothetical protein [Streptomyces sp. NPDC048644]